MQKRRAKIGVWVHVSSVSKSVLFVSLGCKWSILTVTRCAGPSGTQCHTCLTQARLRLSVQNFWISERAWKQKNLNIYPGSLAWSCSWVVPFLVLEGGRCFPAAGIKMYVVRQNLGKTLEDHLVSQEHFLPGGFRSRISHRAFQQRVSGHLTEQIPVPPLQ